MRAKSTRNYIVVGCQIAIRIDSLETNIADAAVAHHRRPAAAELDAAAAIRNYLRPLIFRQKKRGELIAHVYALQHSGCIYEIHPDEILKRARRAEVVHGEHKALEVKEGIAAVYHDVGEFHLAACVVHKHLRIHAWFIRKLIQPIRGHNNARHSHDASKRKRLIDLQLFGVRSGTHTYNSARWRCCNSGGNGWVGMFI